MLCFNVLLFGSPTVDTAPPPPTLVWEAGVGDPPLAVCSPHALPPPPKGPAGRCPLGVSVAWGSAHRPLGNLSRREGGECRAEVHFARWCHVQGGPATGGNAIHMRATYGGRN